MLRLLFACGRIDPLPTAADVVTPPGPETGDAVHSEHSSAQVPLCAEPLADGTAVCLSELQSDNDATLTAGPGVFPDWFELANVGTTPVDPARLLLVVGDRAVALSGAPLLPGGVAVWFADDQTVTGHVDTAFSDEGEEVVLYLDGQLADRWEVPSLVGDTLLARDPASGDRVQTCVASPGVPNPTQPPCADPREALYQLGTISDLYLYVGPEGYATLQSSQLLSYYPEVPARLVFATTSGFAEFPAVGVALKGGYGSFRNQLDYQKPGFKVDLDAFEARRWRGLQRLQLNNAVQDQATSREYLTYALFRAVGIPAPRVGYARVWLDDVYFGFYVQVEPVDSDFLEAWYGNGDGHLLEGAYGQDFDLGDEPSFEYDGGPDEVAGRALITEVATLLATAPRDEATYATLRTLVDMDEWMTNMAVEAAVWHWDGYWTENNYYMYEDPASGLLHILPHGTDQTWTDGWPNAWDGNDRSALYAFCLGVPSCAAMYEQQVLRVADAVDALALEPVLDQLVALTTPEWDADPRVENRCCRQGYVDSTRNRIRTVSQHLRDLAATH
jgi:hypothetical protein